MNPSTGTNIMDWLNIGKSYRFSNYKTVMNLQLEIQTPRSDPHFSDSFEQLTKYINQTYQEQDNHKHLGMDLYSELNYTLNHNFYD